MLVSNTKISLRKHANGVSTLFDEGIRGGSVLLLLQLAETEGWVRRGRYHESIQATSDSTSLKKEPETQ